MEEIAARNDLLTNCLAWTTAHVLFRSALERDGFHAVDFYLDPLHLGYSLDPTFQEALLQSIEEAVYFRQTLSGAKARQFQTGTAPRFSGLSFLLQNGAEESAQTKERPWWVRINDWMQTLWPYADIAAALLYIASGVVNVHSKSPS